MHALLTGGEKVGQGWNQLLEVKSGGSRDVNHTVHKIYLQLSSLHLRVAYRQLLICVGTVVCVYLHVAAAVKG